MRCSFTFFKRTCGFSLSALITFFVITCSRSAEAALSAEPLSLQFGDVSVARINSVDKEKKLRFFLESFVRINNNGDQPVAISEITLSGLSPFSLISTECEAILPGGSCLVQIRYAPENKGSHADELLVQSKDEEVLVVPLSGDAVELLCEGSSCNGPSIHIGSGAPGTTTIMLAGFVNETGGEVLASVKTGESEGFLLEFPPQQALRDGEAFTGRITCTFTGEAGEHRIPVAWNYLPPLIPVMRTIETPFTSTVVRSFDITATSLLPRRFRATGPLALRALPCPEAGEEAGRLIAVPGEYKGSYSIATTKVRLKKRRTAIRPVFDTWKLLPLDAKEPVHTLRPLLLRRPEDFTSPRIGLHTRKKQYLLAYGRKKIRLFDLEENRKKDTVEIQGRLRPLLIPSRIRKTKLYAFRAENEAPRPDGTNTFQLLRLRLKSREDGRVLQGRRKIALRFNKLPVRRAGLRAKRLRAARAVPVQKTDGSWDEMLVAALELRPEQAPAESAPRLLLLGDNGTTIRARKKLSTRRGRVTALAVARRAHDPLGDFDIVTFVGRESNTLLRFRAVREQVQGNSEYTWSWEQTRRRVIGHRLRHLLRLRKKREKDVHHILFAGGRKKHTLLDSGPRRMRRLRMADFGRKRRLAGLIPRRTCTGVRPLYLLVSENNNEMVTALQGDTSAHRPSAYTGDKLYIAQASPDTGGARVTLEAEAADPDNDTLYYSWTAAGISFDDPSSPKPSGFFPVGETEVFLVVRDRPHDDPEGLESLPCIARVVVKPSTTIHTGDANGDESIDISDAVAILQYLFSGYTPPVVLSVLDTNGDTSVNIADAVYLLSYLFAGGEPPVEN